MSQETQQGAQPLRKLGEMLYGLGKLEEAIAACHHALSLQPNWAGTYATLGKVLHAQGKLDESLIHYQKAIQLAESSESGVEKELADWYFQLGNALAQNRQFEEASQHYQQAIAIRPDFREARWNFGKVLYWLGRTDEAIAQHYPYSEKVNSVLQYAQKFNLQTLIETGTWRGHMIEATKHFFKQLVTIELSPELHAKAQEKFANEPHITCLQGDSGAVIKTLLADIHQPCLFWLDGHYSGGDTAKGDLETPILEELNTILNHPIENHVILIDDARCFTGDNDYPSVETIKTIILSKYPQWSFHVKNDIIRACPDLD